MANRTDTFNRADTSGGLGTPSDGGSAWAGSGFYGISGNAAYIDGASGSSIQYLECSASDGTVTITLSETADAISFIIVRYADDNNYIQCRVDDTGGGQALTVYKTVAGVETFVGFRLITPVDGDNFGVTLSGTSVTVNHNGVAQGAAFTINEAALNTNTKHGFILGGSVVRADLFTWTDAGGGGGGGANPWYAYAQQ